MNDVNATSFPSTGRPAILPIGKCCGTTIYCEKNASIADGQLVGVGVVGPWDVFGLDNGLDLGPHSRRVCR